MKHVFIVNPISGKADASLYLVPKLLDAASAADISYSVELTKYRGHATELARQYGERGERVRLYACGGDGTLNEILLGAYPYETLEVASIPCGSGNDFVRSFGTVEEFLNLVDNIAGSAVTIDLASANDGISAAICSVGMDSEVAYNIPKFRRLPLCGGQMAYNLSIIERIMKPMGQKVRITLDDDVLEGNYLICTVCNGVSYGGGYLAAPCADLQDGILDVILVKKMSRIRAVQVLSKYKFGQHLQNGQVIPEYADIMEYRKATRVLIEPLEKTSMIVNLDGECGPAPRLEAQILPHAARFVLPASVYRRFATQKGAVAVA